MKLLLISALAASTVAFSPSSFGIRSTAIMAGSDLEYGRKNGYVPAVGGDGGQGTFGARSPNDWRVPGTSPVGQKSYSNAADGGDEPWFAEAVSTVSLDLKTADATLKAFTKEAANFKIAAFAATKPFGWTTSDAALSELVGKLGYSAFLEASDKTLAKAWESLHPAPKPAEPKA